MLFFGSALNNSVLLTLRCLIASKAAPIASIEPRMEKRYETIIVLQNVTTIVVGAEEEKFQFLKIKTGAKFTTRYHR